MDKERLIKVLESIRTINGPLSAFDCEKIADAILVEFGGQDG